MPGGGTGDFRTNRDRRAADPADPAPRPLQTAWLDRSGDGHYRSHFTRPDRTISTVGDLTG